MPNLEEHCQDTLNRYGYDFREVHKWLDEPSMIAGSKHRVVRHNPFTTPQEAEKIFWDKVPEEQKQNIKHAVLDHIRLDVQTTSFKIQNYHLETIKNQIIADNDNLAQWWGEKIERGTHIDGEKAIPILSELTDRGINMVLKWHTQTKDLALNVEYKEWLEEIQKKILDIIANQIYSVTYSSLQITFQNALENPNVELSKEQRKAINNFLEKWNWFNDSTYIKSSFDYMNLRNEIKKLDETGELEGFSTLLTRVETIIGYDKLKEKLEMCYEKIKQDTNNENTSLNLTFKL